MSTRKKNPKIKQNAPCPCKSGEKYKKCCKNKKVEEKQRAEVDKERLQEERDKLKTALSHQTSSPQGWSIDLKTGETTGNWESVQKAILEENKNVGEFAQKYLRPYREQKDETNVEIITKEFLKLDPYEQRYIIDRWNNEESYRSLIGIDENNRSEYEKLFESILENHHITKYEISYDINDSLQMFTHSRISGERDGKFSTFLPPLREHLSQMSKKKWNWLKERKGRKGSSHLYEIIQTSYLNDDIKLTKDEWEIINNICNEVESEFMNKKEEDNDEKFMDTFGVVSSTFSLSSDGAVSSGKSEGNDPDFQKALELSKIDHKAAALKAAALEAAALESAGALLEEIAEEKGAKDAKSAWREMKKKESKKKSRSRIYALKEAGKASERAAERASERASKRAAERAAAAIIIQKTARGKLDSKIYSKKKLAYSNPENFDTYEKKKHYMIAVLDVLGEIEEGNKKKSKSKPAPDLSEEEEMESEEKKAKKKVEEELFEEHIDELTYRIRSISKKFSDYLFVVVGGAAVKAHHLQTKKEGSTGTGHKTTDFDVKVYPKGGVISEDERKQWVAEARFKIFQQLKVWYESSSVGKNKEFKFSILKGARMVPGGAYTNYCEHHGTWREDLVQPLCVDPTVPIKVSLKTEEKFVPLLEFSFSPSETVNVGEDYTNMVMSGTSFPMNYLTINKLTQVLHENITKSGGFMARIDAKEPNVHRKKILSWFKQLNSLNAVERKSPDGETKGQGGTRKKYRKKYKTRIKKRNQKKKSRKRTKKKHRRKKRKSRKN